MMSDHKVFGDCKNISSEKNINNANIDSVMYAEPRRGK